MLQSFERCGAKYHGKSARVLTRQRNHGDAYSPLVRFSTVTNSLQPQETLLEIGIVRPSTRPLHRRGSPPSAPVHSWYLPRLLLATHVVIPAFTFLTPPVRVFIRSHSTGPLQQAGNGQYTQNKC
jgi:hypothetical protein